MCSYIPNAITLAGAGVLPPKVLSSSLNNLAGSFNNSLKQRNVVMRGAIYCALMKAKAKSSASLVARQRILKLT
jgi:hypothetical protein